MKRVIIRIALLFVAASMLGGCYEKFGPSLEPDTICFKAESMLLKDDATRSSTLLTSEDYVENFSIYSLFKNDADHPVFDGEAVSRSGVIWSYASPKNWEWNLPDDWYDFIAVSPSNEEVSNGLSDGSSRLVGAPGRLTVLVPYDVVNDDVDMMIAVHTRHGNLPENQKVAPVALAFNHMLAAVRVDVINNSSSGNIRVDSYGLKNVVNQATLKATIANADVPSFLWMDAVTTSTLVRQETPGTGEHNPIAPGDSLMGGYNLVIPQDLTSGGMLEATLEIKFTPIDGGVAGAQATREILLDKMQRFSDNSYITEWEIGKVYTYKIYIRRDGGVEVRVITTKWDEIVYETPGIMIHVD